MSTARPYQGVAVSVGADQALQAPGIWTRRPNVGSDWNELWLGIIFDWFIEDMTTDFYSGTLRQLFRTTDFYVGMYSSMGTPPLMAGGTNHYIGIHGAVSGNSSLFAQTTGTATDRGHMLFSLIRLQNGAEDRSVLTTGFVGVNETFQKCLLIRYLKGDPQWTVNLIGMTSTAGAPYESHTESTLEDWMVNSTDYADLEANVPSGCSESTNFLTTVDEDTYGPLNRVVIAHDGIWHFPRIGKIRGRIVS